MGGRVIEFRDNAKGKWAKKCPVAFISLLLIGCLNQAHGADAALTWVNALGSTGYDSGGATTVDSTGNVYMAGTFSAVVDFDPGPGTSELTAETGSDGFVSKYDPDGGLLWAGSFAGTGLIFVQGAAVDKDDNVYVVGSFSQTADFDPGPDEFNLTASGSASIYVVKLDGDGDFLWAKHTVGASNSNATAAGVGIDSGGNAYLTGNYAGTVDFESGPATISPPWRGSSDIFVWKLDRDGNHVWLRSMGSNTVDNPRDISVDGQGNSLTTGVFSNSVDFDPGSGQAVLTSAGAGDAFVLHLDSDGDLIWARSFGGTESDIGLAITTDNSGNILTAGEFRQTADFDPGAGTVALMSEGDRDVFISKFDANGNFVWVRGFGGEEGDAPTRIAVGCEGNIYVSGFFGNLVDFDPGAGTAPHMSAGMSDAFVVRLNRDGLFEWVQAFGDTENDSAADIAIDSTGQVHVTGYYSGTVDFDPSGAVSESTASALYDIFLETLGDTELAPCCAFGDINCDTAVNAVDVQLVINAALSIDTAFSADVNNDDAVNAVDVQLVINAALGL